MTTPPLLLVHCLLAVFLALTVTAASNDSKSTTTTTTNHKHGHGDKALTGRFIHVTGTNNNKAAIDLSTYMALSCCIQISTWTKITRKAQVTKNYVIEAKEMQVSMVLLRLIVIPPQNW